jgi:hypothetical protein
MDYILVKNRQQILLGPVSWRQRAIQNELLQEGIEYDVPTETGTYLKFTDEVEIFPCTVTPPVFNPLYQEPAGPFWTYEENRATGSYNTVDLPLEKVKGLLKGVLAGKRYAKEIEGTTVTINDIEIKLDTTREGRKQYTELLASMGTEAIEFKAGQQFITLQPSDVQTMITAVHTHIQTQFGWEKTVSESIDAASDVDALKNIEVTEINPPLENNG